MKFGWFSNVFKRLFKFFKKKPEENKFVTTDLVSGVQERAKKYEEGEFGERSIACSVDPTRHK